MGSRIMYLPGKIYIPTSQRGDNKRRSNMSRLITTFMIRKRALFHFAGGLPGHWSNNGFASRPGRPPIVGAAQLFYTSSFREERKGRPSVEGYELDNRSANREKAEMMDPGREISPQLLKCRTSKDFIRYAKRRDAKITINSNHVKVSKNGVTTGFSSPGKKDTLIAGVRKQKIEAFMAMGIAWD